MMKHLFKYIRTSGSLFTIVGVLLVLIASCASDDNTIITDTTTEEEDVVFPKEEIKLSIDSVAVRTANTTRSVGYTAQDSTFDPRTTIGLYAVHELRYENYARYLKLSGVNEYTYGMESDGIHYNYNNDGYNNVRLTPVEDGDKYILTIGRPIYYPWGRKLVTDDRGRVAIVTYAPYNSTMLLSTMEKLNGYYPFSVQKKQSTEDKVLASDLIIGLPDIPDQEEPNPFRRPVDEVINIPMKHVLTKVSFIAKIDETDSTKCDSVKVFIKNISTDAAVNFMHFAGIDSIRIRNKNTQTIINDKTVLVTDTMANLIHCTSHEYIPKEQVEMCCVPWSDFLETGQVTSTAIVIPGYVPNLQFSVRLYGAKKSRKDNRTFGYDEFGHQYAEYTPKPDFTKGVDPIFGSGAHYTFLFTKANIVTPVTEDKDIVIGKDDNDEWVVGSKLSQTAW